MSSYILNPAYDHKYENMIEIYPDDEYIKVYYQDRGQKNIGYFIVDIDLLPKVKQHKWYMHGSYHVFNSENTLNIVNLVLDINQRIQNIRIKFKNNNKLDFRRNNIDIIGYTYYTHNLSSNNFYDKIYYQVYDKSKKNKKYYIFGSKYLDEALYALYIFKLDMDIDSKYTDDDLLELKKFDKYISEERKKEIEDIVKIRYEKQ